MHLRVSSCVVRLLISVFLFSFLSLFAKERLRHEKRFYEVRSTPAQTVSGETEIAIETLHRIT